MSVTRRPPLHPDDDSPQVETWELPRWDEQGEPTGKPKKPSVTSTEEDVEPETITLPTAEELRALHEDAYNEGFESGYEQGLRQGQQDGQKQGYEEGHRSGEQAGRQAGDAAGREAALAQEEQRIEQALKPLALLLQSLNGCLTEQQDALESGLIALALRIARQVIDAELKLAPEHINDLVHAAVQALPNADERIVIELHPDDLAFVKQVADSHWSLIANESLSRGGCFVKTRFSYVDYSLEHRYRQQVSNLLAHHGLTEHLQTLEQPWGLPEANAEPETTVDSDPPESVDRVAGEDADSVSPEQSASDLDSRPDMKEDELEQPTTDREGQGADTNPLTESDMANQNPIQNEPPEHDRPETEADDELPR